MPRVSVVVPTFNRPVLLQETVRSILDQTFGDFEIIVVDNFSQADVGALLRGFGDARIRFFQNPNGGIIAVNRNFGMDRAAGGLIAFCDDDDLWDPEKLEKQVAAFDPGKHAAAGSAHLCFGDLDGVRERARAPTGLLGFRDLFVHGTPPLSSLLMARGNFRFSTRPEFLNVEDFELLLRLARVTGRKVLVLPERLVRYRVHEKNQSAGGARTQNSMNVLDHYRDFAGEEIWKLARGRQEFIFGAAAFRAGSGKARAHFWSALRLAGGMLRWKALAGLLLAWLPGNLARALVKVYFRSLRAAP